MIVPSDGVYGSYYAQAINARLRPVGCTPLGGVPVLGPGSAAVAEGLLAPDPLPGPLQAEGDPGLDAGRTSVREPVLEGAVRDDAQQTTAKDRDRQAVADASRRLGSRARPQAPHRDVLRPDLVSGRRRLPLAWLGTIPFFAYALAFLLIPAGTVMVGAFKSTDGGWTLSNISQLFHEPYIGYYETSVEVSLLTALLGRRSAS